MYPKIGLEIAIGLLYALGASVTVTSATEVTTHDSSRSKAAHLLERLSFGPRPGEVDTLSAGKEAALSKWMNEQLHPESIDDSIVEAKLRALPTLSMSIAQLQKIYVPKRKIPEGQMRGGDMEPPQEILKELVAQKIIRGVESRRQFQEVLVDFWFNHFNVSFKKNKVKWFVGPYERDVIRPRVFGKFRDILGAVAKSSAMLFYLDNFQSVRDGFSVRRRNASKSGKGPGKGPSGLNENYGRELLELHTLGVDGGYTQNDVREVARAFTGWTLNQPQTTAEFIFRAGAHDNGPKLILNQSFAAGGGIQDGERVLDLLARHPSTAHFIAKKLCIKFISDQPPESAVKKLADVFIRTQGDLRAVYLELFKLPEFWASAARKAKVKMPLEFVISAARTMGARFHEGPIKGKGLFMTLASMGQALYECVPPTGYSALATDWVNAGALVTRINLALSLSHDQIRELDVDVPSFKSRLKGLNAQNALQTLNHEILFDQMKPETEARLLQELNQDVKVDDEHSTGVIPAVDIEKMLGFVIGSPEFQRR